MWMSDASYFATFWWVIYMTVHVLGSSYWNIIQDDNHPLAHATISGRQDLAEVLIEYGADVDLATNVS